jgi:PelA/Pel-15E family pectate lyase
VNVARLLVSFCLGLAAALLTAAEPDTSAKLPQLSPLDQSGFADSAHHWRNIRDESRFIQAEPGQPSYAPTQVREIVANILLFQRENGGWPKDFDMTAVLTEDQKAKVRATHRRTDTSFDNGNLHSQVAYLARAYAQAGEPAWRAACERGLDFILAAQYPNGGFPQSHPGAKGYAAHITFNDYVMIGCLHLLKDAADAAPHFAWLDAGRRARAADAVRRGIACILRCQIRVDGRLTGWCQQHDEKTYEARPARTFELASICPQDTTEIVRFLMRVESPDAEVREAIEAAVAWLAKVKLTGVRVDKVSAPRVEFPRHTADFDRVVVADPSAPPLWARHYEIGTDRPVFAGRDGVKRYALAEIERERRTGTPWHGTWPRRLLEREYPAWRARLEDRRVK